MHAYKKRLKGNWCQGKRYKGDAEERQYAEQEIAQQLAEAEENFFYRHKGKRKRDLRARLEYRINWYEQAIATRERGERPYSDWYLSYLRSDLRKAKEEYAEKFPRVEARL